MRRPTIRTSLVAIFETLALLLVALSAYSVNTMSSLAHNTSRIGDYWMERVVTAREIKGNINLMRLAFARQLLAEPNELEAETVFRIGIETSLKEAMTKYEAGITTDSGRQLFAEIKEYTQSYVDKGEEMTALWNAGKHPEAKQFFRGEMKVQSEAANKAVGDLVNFIMTGSAHYVAEARPAMPRLSGS